MNAMTSLLIHVSLVAAFSGGALSILSPCSAAMLPIFFAYAFRERAQLVRMTLVFWLGLAVVFIPLGFGANVLGALFIAHRALLFRIAAVIFLSYALAALVGRQRHGIALPTTARPRSLASVFLMGILTAFASGTCTAPILGAILTLAATQSSPILAFILLGVYALGLVVPLFLLAYGFERFHWTRSRWVQGAIVTIPLPGGRQHHLHTSSIIAAGLFAFLAWVFWFGGGTCTFIAPVARLGLADVVYDANAWLLTLPPFARVAALALVVVTGAALVIRQFRRARTTPPGDP